MPAPYLFVWVEDICRESNINRGWEQDRVIHSRGGRWDRTLYADPPPSPPPLLGFGPEVPDHGRRRRPKEILEGEKMGFHPMCLYSKYSFFLGEPNSG